MALPALSWCICRRLDHEFAPRGLKQVIGGDFAYHAVPTNIRAVQAFRFCVADLLRRALRRRSQKVGSTWARVSRLADDFLPRPRPLHPWPGERFAVRHPRW